MRHSVMNRFNERAILSRFVRSLGLIADRRAA